MALKQFATKEDLVNAWINEKAHAIDNGELLAERVKLATVMAQGIAVYVPHLYRGGWVIRDFGYSVERVGMLPELHAGNPALV